MLVVVVAVVVVVDNGSSPKNGLAKKSSIHTILLSWNLAIKHLEMKKIIKKN